MPLIVVPVPGTDRTRRTKENDDVHQDQPSSPLRGDQEMTSTRSARIIAALRLVGVTVVLAAGIAGGTTTGGGDAAPVQLDLAVVSTHAGS